MKYNCIILAIIFLSTGIMAQADGPVALKWKLKPNETLTYTAKMDEINSKEEIPLGKAFSKLFQGADSSKSMDKEKELERFFKSFNEQTKNIEFASNLSEHKPGIIDIQLVGQKSKQTEKKMADSADRMPKEVEELMNSMSHGVQLRGSVYADGGIASFYLKSDQKNLIALFFELPDKKVSIGDTWQLDVNLTSTDQSFICDTAYKRNQVKLIDLKKTAKETIAVVSYDMAEYVSGDMDRGAFFTSRESKPTKTVMKFIYNAIGEFSIDQGRWLNYDGIMSMETNGFMETNVSKRFSLIPQ